MVAVWDERDDYTACTYRSILMVIAASGFTAFPLGAYTAAEAQAFRGGDARLHFGGPIDRALARYQIAVQSPAPYSQAGLREALSVPGRAYAVAGRTANFPAGHSIRRWDPVFAGFHAVCVIPLGGGLCQWLDPLAYTGYAGDTVSVAAIVDTFAADNYPNDARYLPAGDAMPKLTLISYPDGPHTCNIPAGGRVRGWSDTALIHTEDFPTGSSFPADCKVAITQNPSQPPEGIFYHCPAGIFAGLYVPEGDAVDVGPALIDPANCPPPVFVEVPAPTPVPALAPAAAANIVAAKAALALASTALTSAYTAGTTTRSKISTAKAEVTKARTALGG